LLTIFQLSLQQIDYIKSSLLLLFFLIGLTSTARDFPVKIECEDEVCQCKTDNSKPFNVDSISGILKTHRIKDATKIACVYYQLAVKYHKAKDYQNAIKYYRESITLRKKNDDGWLWKSQMNLARCHYYSNNYHKAIEFFEKAKNQAGNPKRSKDSLLIFNLLADSYGETGEFDQALQSIKKAITINTQKEKTWTALITYSEILIEAKDSINTQIGIVFLDSLEKIYLNQDDPKNLLRVKNILGKAYSYLNNYDKSIQYYNEALELEKSVPSKAKLLNNIAITFLKMNDFKQTVNILTQALHLNKIHYKNSFKYEYASNYENFGDYYAKINQLDSALFHYQKALINLTNNFRNEDIFQNPNLKDASLFLYSNPDLIQVLHLKATTVYNFYLQNNNLKYLNLANQTYQTAFDFHDQLQKDISTENSRLFQAKNIVRYIENALKVANEQQVNEQDIGKASFRFMEKNKATVLLQSMNEADALQYANLPDSLLEKEKDLKIAISFHKKQLNDAFENHETLEIEQLNDVLFKKNQQYHQLINNLETNYPKYYQLKYQQNETQLSDVQNQLDDKTALLEYFVGDSAIYILSIQKDQSKLYQIKKAKNWQQTVDNFLSTLNPKEVMKDEYTDELFKAFTQNSHILYQNLLQQPLADLNESITNLQIIPDAELNYIPFDLLLIEQADEKEVDYRALPYLFKQKAISYAYSSALLLENEIENKEETKFSYGGFASSYESNSNYQPLKATAQNVQNIAKLLGGKSNTENEATKANFLQSQSQFNIIQLAMHGILDDENPLNSKLIFTKTNNADDFELHAYELYNMQIPAQLGILSACETGTGKLAKGEGIMSLSRAFTYAGCNSLIMSLWSIEDKATAQVIEGFFKNLKKGKAKHIALQQAKLDFLNTAGSERTHPIYWAGLVQSGNSEPIDSNTTNYLWWSLLLIPFFGLGIGYYLKS